MASGRFLYHALNRAAGRGKVFAKAADYAAFVKVLTEAGLLAWPADWVRQVNTAQTEADLEALRWAAKRGCPFGEEDWQRDAATTLRLGIYSTANWTSLPVMARYRRGRNALPSRLRFVSSHHPPPDVKSILPGLTQLPFLSRT